MGLLKICYTCQSKKELTHFYGNKASNDGLQTVCKQCQKEYRQSEAGKAYIRAYSQTEIGKESHRRASAKYDNSPKGKKNGQDYYQANKKTINAYNQKNRSKYKKAASEYVLNRIKTDINFKLGMSLRTRLRQAIKGNFKNGSAVRDLGCTIPELKLYLESKFQPGMTWENWGRFGWHIDHITPLSLFDLTNKDQLLKACHYSNLQPLWALDNLKKNNKID